METLTETGTIPDRREDAGRILVLYNESYPFLKDWENRNSQPIETWARACNVTQLLSGYSTKLSEEGYSKRLDVDADGTGIHVAIVFEKAEESIKSIPLFTLTDPNELRNIASPLITLRVISRDEYNTVRKDIFSPSGQSDRPSVATNSESDDVPETDGEPSGDAVSSDEEPISGDILDAVDESDKIHPRQQASQLVVIGDHPMHGRTVQVLGGIESAAAAVVALRVLPEAIGERVERIRDGLALKSVQHEVISDEQAKIVLATVPQDLRDRAVELLDDAQVGTDAIRPSDELKAVRALMQRDETLVRAASTTASAEANKTLAIAKNKEAKANLELFDAWLKNNITPVLRGFGYAVGGVVPNWFGGFFIACPK